MYIYIYMIDIKCKVFAGRFIVLVAVFCRILASIPKGIPS